MTTQNRCGYARCAAPLDPDGPSPYWCDETCQANWAKARNNALPLDPAGAAPLPAEPARGADPTFVILDEVAQIPDHAWAPAAQLLDPPAMTMAEARVALAVSRRPAWVRRVLGGRCG